MKNVPAFLLTGALSLGLSPLHAERGVLNADGLLIVKGADPASARITIVPANAPAYALVGGAKRFALRLPVDDTYLVSFVRDGCPTKEVYFDTRVPLEFAAKDFDFPFQVTLEHVGEDRMFSYDGPVGFVRYQHPITDFGYETQYVVKVDEEMHERMREMRTTGTDPKIISAPIAMVVDVSRDGKERVQKTAITSEAREDGVLAATVSEVPRLVHTLSRPNAPEVVAVQMAPAEVLTAPGSGPTAGNAPEEPEITLAPEPMRPLQVEAAAPSAVPVPMLPPSATPVSRSVDGDESVAQTPPATLVVNGMELHREEEMIVDKRMVVRVVRFVAQDGLVVDELRKVTHAFGGVYYFHNAQSITERDFLLSTAQK